MEHTGDLPSAEEQPSLAAGTRLGNYQVVRLLGSGGMGAVYEAVHVGIGKRVAIKTLNPSVAAIPEARSRFLREAELTSKVQHPHIVDVTDMGTEGGHTFIVMELMKGEDLSQRLARDQRLDAVSVADILLPVASAVFTAHEAGIVHRDLKPQNVFLAQTAGGNQPKVLDFGISKMSDGSLAGALTSTGAMVGTPFYLSPEQIEDPRGAGPASDQYALGVMMYECLAGRRPFQGETLYTIFNAIVNGQRPPLESLRPDLPPALVAVVDRSMHRDPRARFPTVASLGAALLPFASTRARLVWESAFAGAMDASPAPVVMPPSYGATPIGSTRFLKSGESLAPVAALPPSRSKTWMVVVGALVAAGVVAAVVLSRSPDPSPPVAAPEAPTTTKPVEPVARPTEPARPATNPVIAAPPADPEEPAAKPARSSRPSTASPDPRESDSRRNDTRRSNSDRRRQRRSANTSDRPAPAPSSRPANPNGAPVLE